MRRSLILILVLTAGLTTIATGADKPQSQSLPLVLAFNCPVGEDRAPSDSEVVAAVVQQLRGTGRFSALAFAPDLPTVTRAVMEGRLSRELLKRPSDPENAVKVASVLGAQYALRIEGTVISPDVKVSLELLKVAGGGRWTSVAESEIASGPREDMNRSNAISSAASSAVSQIVIQVFGQGTAMEPAKPPVETPISPQPDVPAAPQQPDASRDVVAEYTQIIKQVEAYTVKGDLRNAALELRRAINLEPDKTAARVRLAGMYMGLGMTAKAIDECKRALLFNKDDVAVYNMLTRLYVANGALADAAEQCREVIRLEPQNVDVHLSLGDIYWNQAEVDDAMSTYEAALSLDPKNPAPHERLYRLYAAKKMYAPALEHLLQTRLLAADGELDSSGQYDIVAQVIQDEFSFVLGKLDTARKEFDYGKIGRDDYYRECKDAAGRIEALAGFLSTQTAPDGYKEAHPHGVLATSLLAQAGGYMISYLESEQRHDLEQAGLLQAEARTEIELFTRALPGS